MKSRKQEIAKATLIPPQPLVVRTGTEDPRFLEQRAGHFIVRVRRDEEEVYAWVADEHFEAVVARRDLQE